MYHSDIYPKKKRKKRKKKDIYILFVFSSINSAVDSDLQG